MLTFVEEFILAVAQREFVAALRSRGLRFRRARARRERSDPIIVNAIGVALSREFNFAVE